MFAYCPKGGNAKACGINDDTTFTQESMTIKAEIKH